MSGLFEKLSPEFNFITFLCIFKPISPLLHCQVLMNSKLIQHDACTVGFMAFLYSFCTGYTNMLCHSDDAIGAH